MVTLRHLKIIVVMHATLEIYLRYNWSLWETLRAHEKASQQKWHLNSPRKVSRSVKGVRTKLWRHEIANTVYWGTLCCPYGWREACLPICVCERREMAGEGGQEITTLTHTYGTHWLPGTILKPCCILTHWMFLAPYQRGTVIYYPQFTREETEAQRG